MKKRLVGVVVLGWAALSSAAPASAENVVRISVMETANYDTALACLQYYAIAQEISEAVMKNPSAPADVVKGETMRARLAEAMRAAWNKRILAVKGKKTEDQVNTDLQKVSKPMIATANAALDGDKAAAAKHNAVQSGCKTHEKIEEMVEKAG